MKCLEEVSFQLFLYVQQSLIFSRPVSPQRAGVAFPPSTLGYALTVQFKLSSEVYGAANNTARIPTLLSTA